MSKEIHTKAAQFITWLKEAEEESSEEEEEEELEVNLYFFTQLHVNLALKRIIHSVSDVEISRRCQPVIANRLNVKNLLKICQTR